MGRLQSALYVGALCLLAAPAASAYDDRWVTAHSQGRGLVGHCDSGKIGL